VTHSSWSTISFASATLCRTSRALSIESEYEIPTEISTLFLLTIERLIILEPIASEFGMIIVLASTVSRIVLKI
jgi:hypothetical protein